MVKVVSAYLFAGAFAGHAYAAPAVEACPDVEVVFARGSFEPPGIGKVGTGFVDALRQRLSDLTVSAYAVNYPASTDFGRAAEGVVDASARIDSIAVHCPTTEIVLGGYSQGAAVSAYVTSDLAPADYEMPTGLGGPLTPHVAERIASVNLFGTPSPDILNLIHQNAPPISVGAHFGGKTLDLCAPADPICQAGSFDRSAHSAYVTNGMIYQAAQFAASEILARQTP